MALAHIYPQLVEQLHFSRKINNMTFIFDQSSTILNQLGSLAPLESPCVFFFLAEVPARAHRGISHLHLYSLFGQIRSFAPTSLDVAAARGREMHR